MAPHHSGFSTNVSFSDYTHPSQAAETPTAHSLPPALPAQFLSICIARPLPEALLASGRERGGLCSRSPRGPLSWVWPLGAALLKNTPAGRLGEGASFPAASPCLTHVACPWGRSWPGHCVPAYLCLQHMPSLASVTCSLSNLWDSTSPPSTKEAAH
uniref:Uncharacterized protein n=1 Tax=Sus scrofa TaxID=9823 RepID=A0A480GPT0_PIG